jgi:hypothetical protein
MFVSTLPKPNNLPNNQRQKSKGSLYRQPVSLAGIYEKL